MKALITVLVSLFLTLSAWGMEMKAEVKEVEVETPKGCPKTLISDNNKCLLCHVAPDFELKETPPHHTLDVPSWDIKIKDNKLYYKIVAIDANNLEKIFDYLSWHPDFDKHVILEIASFGGSLLEGWRIIGLIQEAQNKGIIVETRVYSHAFSAGFLVAIGGSIGHRFISSHAMIMHHELWSIAWLKLETPSSKEDEAETMRQWQDNVQSWVLSRCTKEISKEFLDSEIRHKDMWMTGKVACDMGFCEGTP